MKITLFCAAVVSVIFLPSCNTMIGVGRDLRMGGEGLEKTANKASGGGSGDTATEDTSGAPVY